MCTISFGEKEAVKKPQMTWPQYSHPLFTLKYSTTIFITMTRWDTKEQGKHWDKGLCKFNIFLTWLISSGHVSYRDSPLIFLSSFRFSFLCLSLCCCTLTVHLLIFHLFHFFFPMQSTLNLAFLCDWVLNVLHVNNVRVCSCLDDYKLFIPPSAPSQTNTIPTATDCLHATVLPVCVYPSLLSCSLYLISYWECKLKITRARELFSMK